MGKKDKKKKQRDEPWLDPDAAPPEPRGWFAALRHAIDQANNSLVIVLAIGATTLVGLLINVLDFRVKEHEVTALAAIKDNPSGILYVQDLGRLPDGRHRFDLAYVLTLKNTSDHDFVVDFNLDRLAIGDVAKTGDVVVLNRAPSLFDQIGNNSTGTGITWHVAAADASVLEGDNGPCGGAFGTAVEESRRPQMQNVLERTGLLPHSPGCNPHIDYGGGLTEPYAPDHTDIHAAHYRVIARPDQFVDVSIAYNIQYHPTLWDRLRGHRPTDEDLLAEANPNDEQVYLGTVLRAHCPLGIKVQNGEVASLCPK